MLELIDISTYYGPVPALRGINLMVNSGEIVSLLGSNGAGKTTTLKTILGLLRAKKGVIRFEDKEIQKWRTDRIVQRIKSEKNLDISLRSVFRIFPILEKRLEQNAGTLSGGEQAMLAIGRGLMGKPKILLLDEPSLGLAPILVDVFFDTIRKINEGGVTIFLIEQNARKALSLSLRGYVIQKGEIIIQGSRQDLIESNVIKRAYFEA